METKICIKKPTTFVSFDKNLLINDADHFFFYTHPNSDKFIQFNLPPGCYYTDNRIHELPNFQPYAYIEDAAIPAEEAACEKAILTNNPHKASIYPSHGIIIVDHGISLLKYWPAKAFVLGHEKGHNYFGPDEDRCDDFSYNVMNRAGFNPSQVYIAAKMLFQKNPARATRLINNIKALNTRR